MREEEIPWLHTPSFSISDQPPHAGKQPALGCRHRLGCCRIAHPVHTAGGLVFKPVLKDCFWCFSTALKPGGMAEKLQKASKGCLGLLPRQQQQLQAPPAHGTARRGTSVWTTGTHLGGNFSQGLQPGHFLQSLFYYTGHSPQTSSSPLSRSLPPPHSYMDITHSKPSGAPAHTGHLQHCSVNVTTNQCHQTCHLQVRIFHQSNPSRDQLSHTHCTPCPAGQPALLRSTF